MQTIMTRKNPLSSDSVHAIRMLRCQSSEAQICVVDPHTSIVPHGRESEDYVILTKIFCSNILRMVVWVSPPFVQMAWVTRGLHWLRTGCLTALLSELIYSHLLSPQTNHLVCISPHSNRDACLCLHPEPGSPVGRVCHSWSFRVGNHYFSVIRVMTAKFINIPVKEIAHTSLQNAGKN